MLHPNVNVEHSTTPSQDDSSSTPSVSPTLHGDLHQASLVHG